ncbi:FMR1-interacting protein NUFIP1-like [Daphnia carinata]|uniref:FMR1-interacting protein NUFIP1-like n=1 Tax=Daphnia carinata TaxID=120202 RepID=UPI00257945FB|nr:FMR1-interacting protein NUFIP1-like [Daphnia carinata]
MALPNPFACGTLHKPSFTPVSSHKNTNLNPGPGLPHAPQPQYSGDSMARMLQSDAKQKTFELQKNNFQSSQFQSFSCDRCDRSFRSHELLNIHISEHIHCGINGCPFVAHPKIVEKHIQMQHETGLAEQIMRLNTPEEIQKWREERRNRFPSTANVARRQAEQKERLERGELLYEPKKKFASNRKQQEKGDRGGGWDARRNKNRKNNGKTEKKSNNIPHQQFKPEFSQNVSIPHETKPFNSMETPESINIKQDLNDGEIISDNKEKIYSGVQPVSSALANLISYASDSEDNMADTKKAKLIQKEAENPAMNCPKESHPKPTKRRKKGKTQKSAVTVPALKELVRPKRLTLLQKLLQGEILHERNIILQCVHFIVQQNFFGMNQGTV